METVTQPDPWPNNADCSSFQRCPWQMLPYGIQFISNLSEGIKDGFDSLCPGPVQKIPCVEENEILSEVYNVIDSEEGLRDPLVFNDPYWPMQWELVMKTSP
ncbi:uncharacterized protein LOC144365869 [Ictidomys tridecemlineatus]